MPQKLSIDIYEDARFSQCAEECLRSLPTKSLRFLPTKFSKESLLKLYNAMAEYVKGQISYRQCEQFGGNPYPHDSGISDFFEDNHLFDPRTEVVKVTSDLSMITNRPMTELCSKLCSVANIIANSYSRNNVQVTFSNRPKKVVGAGKKKHPAREND